MRRRLAILGASGVRKSMADRVLAFPVQDRPAAAGASRWDIARDRMRLAARTLLNRLNVPGALRSVQIDDELTGQQLDISVGASFTRITVNGRDYYFDRVTGRYDGSGMGCS